MSVDNEGILERVHVCFGLGTGGYEEELDAVGPQLPEVCLVLEGAESVELADALLDGPQPSVVGFVELVVVLHLVTDGIKFINDSGSVVEEELELVHGGFKGAEVRPALGVVGQVVEVHARDEVVPELVVAAPILPLFHCHEVLGFDLGQEAEVVGQGIVELLGVKVNRVVLHRLLNFSDY